MSDLFSSAGVDVPHGPVRGHDGLLHYPRIDGPDFSEQHDGARLRGNLKKLHAVMRDGRWRTNREAAESAGIPLETVGAQIRNLRKPENGGHVIEKRRRGDGGAWEYALVPEERR